MGYCAIGDVQALNAQRPDYSATTNPTSTQVTEFIDQIYNEMNTRLLGRKLTVPVTSPDEFVSDLKRLNAYGAAAMAELAMFPEAGGVPGSSSQGDRYMRIYREGLEWLTKGELPTAVETVAPRSFFEQRSATEDEPEETYPWQRPGLPRNKEY